MERTLIVHATLTVEGEREPELIVTQRIPWPAGRTLNDVADDYVKGVCRRLHEPKMRIA